VAGSVPTGSVTSGLAKRATVLAGAATLNVSNPTAHPTEKEALAPEQSAGGDKYPIEKAGTVEEVKLEMSTPGMPSRQLVADEKTTVGAPAFSTTSSPCLSSRLTAASGHKPPAVALTELNTLREWLGQLERRITLQEMCFTGAAAAEALQPLFAALALTKRGLAALERL